MGWAEEEASSASEQPTGDVGELGNLVILGEGSGNFAAEKKDGDEEESQGNVSGFGIGEGSEEDEGKDNTGCTEELAGEEEDHEQACDGGGGGGEACEVEGSVAFFEEWSD